MTTETQVNQLQELFKELEVLERVYSTNKIAFFKPIGNQPKFFDKCRTPVRLVLGSNRSGKSVLGGVEVVAHALGYRPWLPVDHPNRVVLQADGVPIPVPSVGRVIGENFPVSIEQTIWPKLKEWLPECEIAQVKRGQRGYIEKLVLRNGSVIHFMAYQQDVEVFEGTVGHYAWFDEPPPRAIYIAVMRGLVDFAGKAWLTMTPLSQPWTYDDLYAKAGNGTVELINLSIWDNCADNGGFLSRTAITTYLDTLRPEEREAREFGRYIHLVGRVFKDWHPEPPFYVTPFKIPGSWPKVCVIDPHPRKPVAVMWMAYSPSGVKYVYRNLWDEKLRTIKQVSTHIKELEGWGTGWQENVAMRLIDNSAKQDERTSGETVLQRFNKEGIWCRLANKQNYWAGIDAIHEDLRINTEWGEPGLVVFNNCEMVKHNFLKFCYAEWKNSRTEDDHGIRQEIRKTDDDFIDCIRYPYMLNLNYKALSANYKNNEYLYETPLTFGSYRSSIQMPGTHPGMRRTERQIWRTQKKLG